MVTSNRSDIPPTEDRASPRCGKTRYLLAHGDQAAVAIVLILCIVGMLLYVWQRAVTENGIIDIDRAPQLYAEYRVDINSSPWTEIANLPGIGEKLAQSIVQHREAHGPFRRASQLQEVSGIGPSKLRDMLPYLVPLDETGRQ